MSGRNDNSTPSRSRNAGKAVGTAANVGLTALTAYETLHHASVATGAAGNAVSAKALGKKIAAKGSAEGAGKVAKAAAKVAENPLAKIAGQVLDSKIVNAASRLAPLLLAARAGWKAADGFQKDGARGAGRGLVETMDPTALAPMLVNAVAGTHLDERGALTRGYDAAFGRAPTPASTSAPSPNGEQGRGDPTTLAVVAHAAQAQSPPAAAAAPAAGSQQQPRLDAGQLHQFGMANQNFMARQAAAPAAAPAQQQAAGKPSGQGSMPGAKQPKQAGQSKGPAAEDKKKGGPKGFANPSTQRAAQEARGVKNVSDWARNALQTDGGHK